MFFLPKKHKNVHLDKANTLRTTNNTYNAIMFRLAFVRIMIEVANQMLKKIKAHKINRSNYQRIITCNHTERHSFRAMVE